MHPYELINYEYEYDDGYPSLVSMIEKDPKLKYIYDSDSFILSVDGELYKLSSQVLKNYREFIYITKESKVFIYVKDNVLDEVSDYPINNALYIQMLSGDCVVYGDEGRLKQKHIMNQMIYKSVLMENDSDMDGYYCLDISNIFKEYGKYLSKEFANNLFFTTTDLRDYHYTKQKNNAYYHMRAINLPFQNIEFYFIGDDFNG